MLAVSSNLCSRTLFRRLQLLQCAFTPLFDLVEFALHDADIFELAFEVGTVVGEDLEQALELADAAINADVVKTNTSRISISKKPGRLLHRASLKRVLVEAEACDGWQTEHASLPN